jgi:hypothetical protein
VTVRDVIERFNENVMNELLNKVIDEVIDDEDPAGAALWWLTWVADELIPSVPGERERQKFVRAMWPAVTALAFFQQSRFDSAAAFLYPNEGDTDE